MPPYLLGEKIGQHEKQQVLTLQFTIKSFITSASVHTQSKQSMSQFPGGSMAAQPVSHQCYPSRIIYDIAYLLTCIQFLVSACGLHQRLEIEFEEIELSIYSFPMGYLFYSVQFSISRSKINYHSCCQKVLIIQFSHTYIIPVDHNYESTYVLFGWFIF